MGKLEVLVPKLSLSHELDRLNHFLVELLLHHLVAALIREWLQCLWRRLRLRLSRLDRIWKRTISSQFYGLFTQTWATNRCGFLYNPGPSCDSLLAGSVTHLVVLRTRSDLHSSRILQLLVLVSAFFPLPKCVFDLYRFLQLIFVLVFQKLQKRPSRRYRLTALRWLLSLF